MGCGCKKRNVQPQNTPLPVEVQINFSEETTSTELGYLSGVTSSIQTQLNSKQVGLNGTGFVKATGTTISYDNSTYYLASNPDGFINSSGTAAAVSKTVDSAQNAPS